MSAGMMPMTRPLNQAVERTWPPTPGSTPDLCGIPRPALPLLSQQANLWKAHSFPAGLLLQGDALSIAENWAARHADELEEEEADFLRACRDARTCAQRDRRLAGLVRGCLVATAIAALVVVRLLLQARSTNHDLAASVEAASQQLSQIAASLEGAENRASLEAGRQAAALRRMAEKTDELRSLYARALAASSAAAVDRDRQLGLLLALEALLQSPEDAWNAHGEAGISILRALAERGWQSMPVSPSRDLRSSLAWRSPGGLLLTHPDAGDPAIWVEATGERLATLSGCSPLLYAVWSPDGKLVATLGRDGTARTWTAYGAEMAAFRSDPVIVHAAWEADSRLLATLDGAGNPVIWDGQTGQRLALGNREDVLAFLLGLPTGMEAGPAPYPRPIAEDGRSVYAAESAQEGTAAWGGP